MTPELELFTRFGLALFIGLLIGLEREYAAREKENPQMAGVRTHALISLLGAVAAMAGDQLDNPLGFISISIIFGGLVVAGYYVEATHGERGLTSEVATLLTYLSGALCYWQQRPLAVALGVTTMALLSLKPEIHTFAQRLTREDVYATLKFAVITAIVLPVLPNKAIGPAPWDAVNPYKIWQMVVLISGLSFCGYALMKVIKSEQAISLTGILGGLVSSTALTLSFTQRSREAPDMARAFAMGICLAWTMMFARIIVIVGIIYGPLLRLLWPPMIIGVAVGSLYSLYLWRGEQHKPTTKVDLTNPFKLGPAFKFALLYALILLIARVAQLYSGAIGVYISSALGGLTTVDAILLSLTELARLGNLEMDIAARGITIAATVNTLFKGSIIWFTAEPRLRRVLLPGLGLMVGLVIGAALF